MDQCRTLCSEAGVGPVNNCMLVDAGSLDCASARCLGRRPERWSSAASRRSTVLGEHFARAAQLEAASVEAFAILKRELRAHGAPARLVRGAASAARDEGRHVRATRALAARFGGTMAPICVERPAETRTLEVIAIENAAEGCARETYGAMEAAYQARAARDPVVRAALRRIARDEARHAAVAWSIDAWARGRLSRAGRARVDAARDAALADLAREIGPVRAEPLHVEAGIPRPEAARRLLAALGGTLQARRPSIQISRDPC
jgi:hypothetical protein